MEPAKKTKDNFEFLKVIGEGSFSTVKLKLINYFSFLILYLWLKVHLAKEKKSGQLFAIKECDKHQIIRENKVKYVHLEKRVLAEYLNDHPFLIKLCATFQDDSSLCKLIYS